MHGDAPFTAASPKVKPTFVHAGLASHAYNLISARGRPVHRGRQCNDKMPTDQPVKDEDSASDSGSEASTIHDSDVEDGDGHGSDVHGGTSWSGHAGTANTHQRSASDASQPPASMRPRRRTVRACEGCRKKKIACNGKQPCASCVLRSRDCVYTSLTVTGRPSKGALKLLQHQVQELEKEVEHLRRVAGAVPYGDSGGFGPATHTASSSGHTAEDRGANEADLLSATSTTFGPEAYEQQRRGSTTREEDDIFYVYDAFTRKLSLEDHRNDDFLDSDLKRKLVSVHTSFRLDKRFEYVYMTGSGIISKAMRLQQALLGNAYGKKHDFSFVDKADMGDASVETITTNDAMPDPYDGVQSSTAGIASYWPSREREDQLCNIYFRLVHPTLPILSREILTLQRSSTFRSIFEQDPIWLSVMLGVFISAARYIASEQHNSHAWWEARMRLGSFDVAHSRSIGGIQNLVLSSEVGFELFATTHSVWMAVGMALRSLQSRGLHRENVLVDLAAEPEWTDIVRCLWWSLQKLDIDLCSALGYTPAAMTFDLLPPRTSSKVSPMPYFRAMTKGLKMHAQSLDRVVAQNPVNLRRQYDEVEGWLNELRTYLPFVPKERDDEKFFACAKLWLYAYHVVAITYRVMIVRALKKVFQDREGQEGDGLNRSKAQPAEAIDASGLERDEVEAAFSSLKAAIKGTCFVVEALVKRCNTGETESAVGDDDARR